MFCCKKFNPSFHQFSEKFKGVGTKVGMGPIDTLKKRTKIKKQVKPDAHNARKKFTD